MGQNESKQRLEQIERSLERIRKDLRTGKITANDVERIQGILQKYSEDYEKLPKKQRINGIDRIQQQIEVTSKELDGLKEEVNLDLASVPTNSFSRASSKRHSKEKRKSIKSIKEAVENIRQQIRNGQVKEEDHDQLQSELVAYSQLLSWAKGKKPEIDATQKLISSVSGELFQKQQQQENTDGTMHRSVTPPVKKPEKRSSVKDEPPKITNKNNTSNLDDIASKLDTLKNDIIVAETNKDKNRIRFLGKSIQTLMTDLQMVDVKDQILNEERKLVLESNLVRANQHVEKIKRQISTEGNINYLANLEKKEKKGKTLQELDYIHKTLMTFTKNLSLQNYEAEKETFNKYKTKLESIEENDQEISLKKSEVSDIMMNIENAFTRLEMEYRLNQAEWRHCQYKINLQEFSQTTEDELYKKHKQYLLQLKEYVDKILEINTKVDEKKKYVLYNIENNIRALDQRAKENETKSKSHDEKNIILRRTTTPKTLTREVANNLIVSCKEIPGNCSPHELRDVLPLLNEAKTVIDQKLNLLQGQIQKEKKEELDTHLVTVKEKQLQSPMSKPKASVRTQLENLQKEAEALQNHVENSHYTKESQLYKDIKNKLESFKIQVRNLARRSDDGGKLGENILKYIDNVTLLLENNFSGRKSTTEDILIDIMSISTRVNDLGNKIQGFNYTSHDYDSIKNSLLEHRHYLKNLQIAQSRSNLIKSREEILRQIENHLSKIDDLKKNLNSTSGSEEEKRFNQDLRKLKEKVSRYSGTYRNVLYKTIENDLDKHLNNVDKVFKDSTVAVKVKREIENSKMILEQKSSKDQKYTEPKPEPNSKELSEIRENVNNVKKELSQIRTLTKEELEQLDARLTLSILALDNIKDDHSNGEKQRLYQDIHYYFAQIQELKLFNRPNSVLVEDLQQKEMDEAQRAAKSIATIESELEEIKSQILTFVGTETSPLFCQLDEVLVRGTISLDELNIDQTSELYHLKVKLMRDIHKYSDILDERINQTEQIEKLEQDVKVMLMKIDSFNGFFGDPEYAFLDEQIIRLKVALGQLHVNQELIGRRETCIREVDTCMKKLNEAAKPRSDDFAGTLV